MYDMKNLQDIYHRLSDEVSRYIYEKRLLYSITGDDVYLKHMIHWLMDRYGENDVMNRLLSWISQKDNRKIVVFGAGFAGSQIAGILSFHEIKVYCICDNDKNKHGKNIQGYRIHAPSELTAIKDACVVIGVNKHQGEVRQQLMDMGISDDDIFDPGKEWWLGVGVQYFEDYFCPSGKNEAFVDGGALDGEDSIRFVIAPMDTAEVEPAGTAPEITSELTAHLLRFVRLS